MRIQTIACAALLLACTTPAFKPLLTVTPTPRNDVYTKIAQAVQAMGYTIVTSDRDAGSIIAEKDAGTGRTFSTTPERVRKVDRLEISVFSADSTQTSIRVMPVSTQQVGARPATRDSYPRREALVDASVIIRMFGAG